MPANDLRRRATSLSLTALGLLASVMQVVMLSACPASAADDYAARREQIAKMSPAEQQDLLRKQERFLALPVEEQNRLRELQAAVDADPNAEKLHETLVLYHEWLKTLSPTQRAQLADLPPADRIRQIKRIKQQQESERQQLHLAELLSSKDLREILRWADEVIWARREALKKEMQPKRREAFAKLEQSQQHRQLMAFVFERSRRGGGPGSLATIEADDIDSLAGKISAPAKAELEQASSLEARRHMVSVWVRMAIQRAETFQAKRKLGDLGGEELVQFFQRQLPPQKRESLLKMPSEEMRKELRRLYLEHQNAEIGFSDRLPFDRRNRERPNESFRKAPPPAEPTPPQGELPAKSQP